MDERTRYFRRLKRLRNSARRWSVLGGGLVAATAVLTPYSGIGIAYAIWSGLGIVLISAVGLVFFRQKLDLAAIVGLVLIIAGVLVVNLFSKSVSH